MNTIAKCKDKTDQLSMICQFILDVIESIWTSDSSDILGKFEGPPSMCSKVEVRNSLILCGPAQFKIKVDGSETKLAV